MPAFAHLDAKHLVALLQERILGRDFAQTFRMRVDQLQIFAPAARGLRLRLLHGVEHGIDQIQRKHHQHARERIGALQLPGNPAGKALHLFACVPADTRDTPRHTGSAESSVSA